MGSRSRPTESFLLDTCDWLDWALGSKIRASTLNRLEDALPEGRIYLSSLSVQETMRLAEKGRLELLPTPSLWVKEALQKMPLLDLPLTRESAFEAGCLMGVNGDPVDRGILASAMTAGLTLVTRDQNLLLAAREKRLPVMDTR